MHRSIYIHTICTCTYQKYAEINACTCITWKILSCLPSVQKSQPPSLSLGVFIFPFQNFVAGENKYSDLSIPENKFSSRAHAEKNLSRQNLPAPPPPLRIKWSPPYRKQPSSVEIEYRNLNP